MKTVLVALGAIAVSQTAIAQQPSPREVVEAKFAAVNRHQVSEIAKFYAPDAVLTASDFCAPRAGRGEVERTYRAIFDAVADVAADVQEYIVEGDRVAVKFMMRGNIAGRAFSLPIMNFFTVRDGLIVKDDGMFDNGGRACTP